MNADADFEDAGDGPEALPRRRKPGPPQALMSEGEKAAFLIGLAKGEGRELAASRLGVSYRRLWNTLRADDEFHREALGARRAAEQAVSCYARGMALNGNVAILFNLLNRYDRAKYLNRARRDRKRERLEDQRFLARQADKDRALLLYLCETAGDLTPMTADQRRQAMDLSYRAAEADKDRALKLHLAELQFGRDRSDELVATDSDRADPLRLTTEQVARYRKIASETFAKHDPAGAGRGESRGLTPEVLEHYRAIAAEMVAGRKATDGAKPDVR